MTNRSSLSFKILSGFFVVTTFLIVILFANNMYAMNVVREEVSKTARSLLGSHVQQIDQELEKSTYYLLRLASTDTYYSDLVSLSVYPIGSTEYFFARQRIRDSFRDNMGYYPDVDLFFAYSSITGDLITSPRTFVETEKTDAFLKTKLTETKNIAHSTWTPVRLNDVSYLLRVDKINNADVYVGALVNVNSLLETVKGPTGGDSEAYLMTPKGEPVNESRLKREELEALSQAMERHGKEDGSFSVKLGTARYLVISYPFHWAELELTELVSEQTVLRQLPYFQKAIYLIPVAGLIVLAAYAYFLKRVLQKPMNNLMNGMRRIICGDIEFRLADGSSREFAFLIDTFNKMVKQIRHLKIDIYEERLKKQEAEFKHLQAQINPHFYLNSLNIIYSLSVLEENGLVQKMAEHLADYFRFIMRAHRESIQLSEEMAHIRNYLEIQKLRFPEKLTYEMSIPQELEGTPVLPLTVQPFVENAIIHGMDKGKRLFHVSIRAELSKEKRGYFEVTIADNGKGFPEKLLEELRSDTFEHGGGIKHLGIWNVRQRLRMKYGDDIGIGFANADGQGAEVVITLPLAGGEADGEDAGS